MPTYGELSRLSEKIAAAPPRIPLNRKVGVEIETQGSIGRLAQSLRDAGLADNNMSGACAYHCGTTSCGSYLVHPTSDCTITGPEVVVGGPRGTPINTPELHDTIERTCAILLRNGARTDHACGGHVHVDTAGLNSDSAFRLVSNFSMTHPDFARLMAADLRTGIRHSETPPTLDSVFGDGYGNGRQRMSWSPGNSYGRRGYWMWFAGRTVEFRGWNGTLMAWRIALALHVSAAMVEAAIAGRVAEPNEALVSHCGDWLPGYIIELLLQQYGFHGNLAYNADSREIIQVRELVNA